MKKVFLIALSACLAFLATELVVRYLVGYPTYGIEKKVKIRDIGWSNIWKPHSKYWNVEGGNRVFRNNNVGLPGIDVKVGPDIRYVAVLGSSFVEARQVPPEKMATSFLNVEIEKMDNKLQVLNLGYGGHDPNDSFQRLAYFEQFFLIEKVILVIDSTFAIWLNKRRSKRKAHVSERFETDMTFLGRIRIYVANHFSVLSLIGKAVNRKIMDLVLKREYLDELRPLKRETFQELYKILDGFNKKYQNKFVCCSIVSDRKFTGEISKLREKYNFFHTNNVHSPSTRFDVNGHLNEKGHEMLGEFLHISLILKN
jgi:hypothetical protein